MLQLPTLTQMSGSLQLLAKALYRPGKQWNPQHTESLPQNLLRVPGQPVHPALCRPHSLINEKLQKTLAERITREALICYRRLTNYLTLPLPAGINASAARRLLKGYEMTIRIPRGCDGCFVTEMARNTDCLGSFLTGRFVWRKDASPLLSCIDIWAQLAASFDFQEVNKNVKEVRKLARAVQKSKYAELEAGGSFGKLAEDFRFDDYDYIGSAKAIAAAELPAIERFMYELEVPETVGFGIINRVPKSKDNHMKALGELSGKEI